MLPIKSPFDTFRAGLWVAKRNVELILVYVALMVLHGRLSGAFQLESVGASMGVGVSLLVSLASLLVSLASLALPFLIPALLIFPLHATFLSDGRVAGFAAIRDFSGLCWVAWRAFLIFFAAMVSAAIVFAIGAPVMGGGFGDFVAASEAAQAGDAAAVKLLTTYVVAMSAVGIPLFGAFVILLGLRIPHIVEKGKVKSASSSIRRGASQFWRMAAYLAAGPGTVILAQYVVWRGFFGTVAEALARGPDHPVSIASNVVGFFIYAFCIAMTAGVLSDAYRRALAQEAQSRSV